jgi:hypothetical protein
MKWCCACGQLGLRTNQVTGAQGPQENCDSKHILLKCPNYAEACAKHLVKSLTNKVVSMQVLLGTLEGNTHLLGFLKDTNTFFKTCWPCAAQPPVANEDSGKG